ncbi:hypothetical protein R3P38DRAFT_2819723 [Favolaschia claudopus]|uniref:Uncharacterized protein n=1 Tax=Favolaschia claudopus TaxID=2862362 RepID=A0AAW0EG57_9AGAR
MPSLAIRTFTVCGHNRREHKRNGRRIWRNLNPGQAASHTAHDLVGLPAQPSVSIRRCGGVTPSDDIVLVHALSFTFVLRCFESSSIDFPEQIRPRHDTTSWSPAARHCISVTCAFRILVRHRFRGGSVHCSRFDPRMSDVGMLLSETNRRRRDLQISHAHGDTPSEQRVSTEGMLWPVVCVRGVSPVFHPTNLADRMYRHMNTEWKAVENSSIRLW